MAAPLYDAPHMTSVHEIADQIYKSRTPVPIAGTPGFSFNQYVKDGAWRGDGARLLRALGDSLKDEAC